MRVEAKREVGSRFDSRIRVRPALLLSSCPYEANKRRTDHKPAVCAVFAATERSA